MKNELKITGNLTKDPELKYSSNGVAWCTMRLAIPTGKSIDGESWETRFTDVVCFRSLAENAAASFSKGDRVLVIGELKIQKYISKAGNESDIMKIEASEVCPSLWYATVKITRVSKDEEDYQKKRIAGAIFIPQGDTLWHQVLRRYDEVFTYCA